MNYRPTWDLNVTDPVSGNFYPVVTAISMKDSDSSRSSARELSILVDRGQAGGSHREGELQLMPHRRLLFDDNRSRELSVRYGTFLFFLFRFWFLVLVGVVTYICTQVFSTGV